MVSHAAPHALSHAQVLDTTADNKTHQSPYNSEAPWRMFFQQRYKFRKARPRPCLDKMLVSTFGKYGDNVGEFDTPSGVCVNADDQLIVADALNHRIQVFDSNQKFLLSFGSEGNDFGQFQQPNAVCVCFMGQIVVADGKNHRIQVFSKNGVFLFGFAVIGVPLCVCLDQHDNIVVGTPTHIQKFNLSGVEISSFKLPNCATSVAVNSANKLYCLFHNDNRIFCFDENGYILTSIAIPGDIDSTPKTMLITNSDDIILADALKNSISLYNSTGLFVDRVFGLAPHGRFLTFGLTLDSVGRIYAADVFSHRIQMFRPPSSIIAQ